MPAARPLKSASVGVAVRPPVYFSDFKAGDIRSALYTTRSRTADIICAMSSQKWVLRCKQCRSECVYAEIPSEGAANYFFPKKPEVPAGLTFKCPDCGHKDSYTRADLVYHDDATSRSPAKTKCA